MTDETHEDEESQTIGQSDLSALLCVYWTLGFHDRGHGHGDFGVITVDEEKVVLERIGRDLAEHIIKLHNDALDT